MFTKYNLPFLLFIFMINLTYSQTISNDYYGVKAGQGKGIKFWNNHNYKIHMGNTDEYKYGPVNSYSIKMNMTGNLGRGWTWGTHLNTPVTALDNRGNLQTKGWLRSDKRILLFGSKQKLYGDNSSKLYWTSNHSTATQIVLRDVDNKQYGKLLGAADGNLFGLTDGDGHWSYKAFKDNYTSFHINNSEKMRISANGHVDISPNDYNSRLTVGGIGVFGLTYIGGSLDGTYFPDAVSGAYNLHLNAIKTNNIGGDIIFQSEGATKMTMSHAGKLIIGDVNGIIGDYKLYVEKGVLAEKVRVAVKNTTYFYTRK